MVGPPDEQYGQLVAASPAEGRQLLQFRGVADCRCRSRLASYQIPRVWRIAKEISKNALGKTNKKQLIKSGTCCTTATRSFTSNLVQDLLFAKGVTALDFPPYSLDLNPMENLWATLARAVERYQADTIEALQDAIEAEWNKIDIAHFKILW